MTTVFVSNKTAAAINQFNTKSSLKVIDDLFASDKAVFVFPAGLVSRRKKGVIADLEWKKTFIMTNCKNSFSFID